MYSEVPQDKIANTACLLSTMNTMHTKKSQPSCKEKLCNFFYFWLGDKLEGKLKGGYAKLKEVIQSIYIKLNDGPNNELCANTFLDSTMHNTVNSSILKQRKKVFDYYYDYRTIWTKIKDSQAAGTPCTTAYDTYLTGVKGTDEDRGDRGADGAYGQIKASGSLNQDLYFKKFWDKFEGNGVSGGGTIPEPSKLKSKATGGDDPPPPSPDAEEANLLSCLDQLSSTVSSKPSVVAASSPQVEDGGTTTTPAIISSTLGTLIGLPTLAFMLYKYNLLPPWIRNTFKGRGRNRRRKRSAIRRNFETLTTDTSSLYTTDNSTYKPFFFNKHNHSEGNRRKRSISSKLNRFSGDDTSIEYSSEYSTAGDDGKVYSVPYIR
ncbi:KIR protein [Plasmodium coatneyi]|uniref:KIR protein n=1 Tax=Plasmodium coatneyi TaxID=208452 RepID=A0A1B1DTY0_9APIC|nr:KIR protein [Plasmodium coatneyi]ANQ06238.1 KIR protein [Plasmodium coatneyi]